MSVRLHVLDCAMLVRVHSAKPWRARYFDSILGSRRARKINITSSYSIHMQAGRWKVEKSKLAAKGVGGRQCVRTGGLRGTVTNRERGAGARTRHRAEEVGA